MLTVYSYDKEYIYMLEMERAEHYYNQGYYEEANRIIGSFSPSNIPCPLIYLELKAKITIGLKQGWKLGNVLSEVADLIKGKELGLNKQETLNSIRLRIAIFREDMEGVVVYSNLLFNILKQLQIPFSGSHIILIRGFLLLGYSKIKIARIYNKFEKNQKSIPYILEYNSFLEGKGSTSMFSENENIAEMIFMK